MGLSLEPEQKNNSPLIMGIIIVVLSSAGLLWWQKDQLPVEIQGRLPAAIIAPTATVAPRPTPSPANRIELVYSSVVEGEDSPAFTAEFYLDEAEHPDTPEWVGLGGRSDIEIYTVQEGDTLWSIAAQFSLDVDTLRWSNPDLERNPDLLSLGTELTILPVKGVYHIVTQGETLEAIATRYGVADVDIRNYPLNELLPPYKLSIGEALIIPNGRKKLNIPVPSADPGYPLAWPLVGTLTQGYHPDHLAIDIGSAYGAKVYAAADGTVIHAQWARTGYGFTVIIDHGEGLQTLYSHLKGTLVSNGEQVIRGQVIGAVGSTGNSTGPHAHFEVRENGKRVDPFDYLRH